MLNDVSYAEAEFGDYMDNTDCEDEETSTPDAVIPGLQRVLSFSDHELVTGDKTFICFLQQLLTLAKARIPEHCSVTDCRQPIRISPLLLNCIYTGKPDLNTISIKKSPVLKDHIQILPRAIVNLTCIKRPQVFKDQRPLFASKFWN